jgi:GH35 family endo-1,4-beta-xylanase
MGENWVTESFRLARKHCPDATLVLNDYYVLSWDADKFVEFLAPIIAAGDIDAIGAEAHHLEDIDLEIIKANLDRLANLGLPIYISEYDIAEFDDAKQLAIMQTQFPVFYNHPAVVGITFWGHYQGNTWRPNTHLVNKDGTPRPALSWLMSYIADHPKKI